MDNVLKDKEFIKNTGKLFGSSVIAQSVPFAVLPILTRIYSPDDFGFWAYFLSLSGIVSILMTGNYEFAIIIPKDKNEAINIFSGSVFLTLFTYIIGLITIFFFYIGFDTVVHSCISEYTAYLIVTMAAVMAVFRLLNFWNNRINKFHITAAGNISRAFSVSLLQLYNGFFYLQSYSGLILSSIIGYIIGCTVQMKSVLKEIYSSRSNISTAAVKNSLKRYKDFPKYFMPSEFLNNLSMNIPVLFLTNIFDTAAAGLYAIPHRFINVPMMMLGSSISQAYLKKSSDMVNNDQDLGRTTADLYRKLFMLGIIPLSLISGYGDYIFGFILGDKWSVSGLYASMLSPWMLMVFVASPLSIIFATLEKQKISMVLNIVLLIIRVLSFVIGGLIFKSVFAAVFLYAASGFIFWTFYSFFVVKISGSGKEKVEIVRFVLNKLLYIMLPIILSRIILNAVI